MPTIPKTTATGRSLTLAELRDFVAACTAAGLPEVTTVRAATRGLNCRVVSIEAGEPDTRPLPGTDRT